LIETIVRFNPDLLGTQETLKFQRDYLAEQLKDYEVLGVGRDDGKDNGEMMALYYKRSRFEAIESGHFWLSESPDEVGSKSWDSSLPRMVTWVKLRDRNNASAMPIAFFNTHFDHRGPEARLESARLLREKAADIGRDCSIVITGDFNCGEGSAPYQALLGGDAPVVDAYRSAHPERDPSEGTFSGFDASATSGERIDWICVSKDWEVASAAIDHSARDERSPSDHFPVTAVLQRP
jgi:endonuclease/exonuclease/phosphatase family metal-dependent hydrolase